MKTDVIVSAGIFLACVLMIVTAVIASNEADRLRLQSYLQPVLISERVIGHLVAADKAPAPKPQQPADDLDSFVLHDVRKQDRPAALLGAQRAMAWLENHGAISVLPQGAGP